MNKKDRRIKFGVERRRSLEIEVDGELIEAYEGESVATALIASGRRVFRKTEKGEPRGMYCGIGQCQECRMTINSVPNTLACQTIVNPGCKVELHVRKEIPEEG